MIGINKKEITSKKIIYIKNYISDESTLYKLPDGKVYKEFKGPLMHERKHRVNYLIEKMNYLDRLPKEIVKFKAWNKSFIKFLMSFPHTTNSFNI